MMIPSYQKQSGFTLVEIAIVLVVIGLLLGGVLKGTELIENSKVRKAVSEVNGVTAAYYSYQDRYNRIPGDDGPNANTLRARGGEWANINQAGDANGALQSRRNQIWQGGDEQTAFWQHVRAAGFIGGDPSDQNANALPRNAFGGLIGVLVDPMGGGLTGPKVCMSQVPGKSALAMDNQMDDGESDSGRMRASDGRSGRNQNPGNTASTAYAEDEEYTVCVKM